MVDIWTDGSYMSTVNPNIVGWAFVIPDDHDQWAFQNGVSDDPMFVSSHNVGGEILAVVEALKWCRNNNINIVHIHHDYVGVAKWITGEWQCKTELTKWYEHQVTQEYLPYFGIKFEHCKGHSGDIFNIEADRWAKEAIKECTML